MKDQEIILELSRCPRCGRMGARYPCGSVLWSPRFKDQRGLDVDLMVGAAEFRDPEFGCGYDADPNIWVEPILPVAAEHTITFLEVVESAIYWEMFSVRIPSERRPKSICSGTAPNVAVAGRLILEVASTYEASPLRGVEDVQDGRVVWSQSEVADS